MGDIPAIVGVQEKTWWVTYEPIIGKAQCDDMFEKLYSPGSLTRQIEELGHTFLLLILHGTVCGFASYSPLSGQRIYKLHKIYIAPEVQGTGAGRLLLAEVEQLLTADGVGELRLNVNRHNPARFFYEKLGFSILFEEDIPIGDFWMNDFVMGKKLGLT